MYSNIKKNNVRGLSLKLRGDKYYDFMLYKGETYNTKDSQQYIATSFNIDGFDSTLKVWKSSNSWNNAINRGLELKHIGLSGVDNGFISLSNDLSQSNVINTMTNAKFIINEGDNRLHLYPVSSNTVTHVFPIEINDKHISLKGGFFQGFYQIAGDEYQVLPSSIDYEWNLQFVLRKQEYDIENDTLNTVYPNNNGIFFYMGTRAENKFSLYYNKESYENKPIDGYFAEETPDYEYDNEKYYLYQHDILETPMDAYNSNCDCDELYFKQDVLNDNCVIDDYFMDDYTGLRKCSLNGLAIDDEYFGEIEEIVEEFVDDLEIEKYGYNVLTTDNKFILFNQSKTGFTVDNWDNDIETVEIYDIPLPDNDNKFITFNRTKTGYTTDLWKKEYESYSKEYDIISDITENAFGLQIFSDGSIGYKYIISSCENERGYDVIVEKSRAGIINSGEWASINVKIKSKELNTIQIYFYVGGNLVFVSKSLPEFRFRALNDTKKMQEGVPFNISLGGGTQGLIDGIWPENISVFDDTYPLMKEFGGTFIGDIKSFIFFNGFIDHKTIKNSVFEGK